MKKSVKYVFDRNQAISDIFSYYENKYLDGELNETDFSYDSFYKQEDQIENMHEYFSSLKSVTDEFLINELKNIGLDIVYKEKKSL